MGLLWDAKAAKAPSAASHFCWGRFDPGPFFKCHPLANQYGKYMNDCGWQDCVNNHALTAHPCCDGTVLSLSCDAILSNSAGKARQEALQTALGGCLSRQQQTWAGQRRAIYTAMKSGILGDFLEANLTWFAWPYWLLFLIFDPYRFRTSAEPGEGGALLAQMIFDRVIPCEYFFGMKKTWESSKRCSSKMP